MSNISHPSSSRQLLPAGEGATAPPPLLLKAIKEAVARGDKAKVRAENFYITAGQHLKNLKENFNYGGWSGWEQMLRVRCNLSASRASELMAIADGRKTLEQVRASTAKRVMKHAKSSSLANEEQYSAPPAAVYDQDPETESDLRLANTCPDDYDLRRTARVLIDDLLDHNVRAIVISMVINGERQNDFAAVSHAVADLYQRLSRAGR